jgi:hypothetical protein
VRVQARRPAAFGKYPGRGFAAGEERAVPGAVPLPYRHGCTEIASFAIVMVVQGGSAAMEANFRELMARIGWSDTELSRRVSVRPGAIRDWQTGPAQIAL